MRTRLAAIAAATVLFLSGCLVASADAPTNACDSVYTSNTIAALKNYSDCRSDRIEAQLTRIENAQKATPSPSASATPSATPTPSTTSASPPPTATTPATGFPDTASTGPTGTLTAYTGPATITAAGTVIDGKTITACLAIKANDVTIRNSLIKGNCFFNVLSESGNTGLQLIDVEIDGLNANPTGAAIGVANYTCLRCDIHGTGDGLKASDNVTIRDSFVHDLAFGNDSHNDGVQVSDGKNIVLDHNSINPTATNATSAVLIKADFGPISNVKLTNNLLAGGAYTLYAGDGYSCCPDATGVVVSGNKFSTAVWPKGGYYGPITNTGSGVTVTGNTWADGANVGQTVS